MVNKEGGDECKNAIIKYPQTKGDVLMVECENHIKSPYDGVVVIPVRDVIYVNGLNGLYMLE